MKRVKVAELIRCEWCEGGAVQRGWNSTSDTICGGVLPPKSFKLGLAEKPWRSREYGFTEFITPASQVPTVQICTEKVNTNMFGESVEKYVETEKKKKTEKKNLFTSCRISLSSLSPQFSAKENSGQNGLLFSPW